MGIGNICLSAGDLINVGVLIVSCIGIFLTYSTLLEMKKQRIISIRPFPKFQFEEIIEFNIYNILEHPQSKSFNIMIMNVGNGLLKDLRLDIDLDERFAKSLDTCILFNDLLHFNIEINNRVYIINETYKNITVTHEVLEVGQSIDVAQASIVKLVNFLICIYYYKNQNFLIDDFIILKISLQYSDIMDNIYEYRYNLKLQYLSLVSENGTISIKYRMQIDNEKLLD